MPPITAPTPMVEISRNLLRGYRTSVAYDFASGSGSCAAADAAAAAAFSGVTSPASARCVSVVRSRTQRNANTSATTAPSAAMYQEMMIPTSSTTTPIAKPTGQRLGPGTCGCSSWLWFKTL